ncbi:MAG: hypothetical protein LBP53_05980 [Candidatus Peribacteria bacterium]|jgi:hypothetical protein|nr:hypothetical protein [Candidatus Peribacteria bacterium]
MKIIYPKNFASSRNEVILQYCKGKKILHIGATDAPYTKAKYQGEIGPLLYREIDKVCISQLAIDIDTESIKFLSDKGNEFPNSQLIAFDMNRLQDLNFTPDVIVF